MKHTFIRKLACLVFIFAFICISSSTKAQCPTITISPATIALPAGTVGTVYSQQITQSGLTGAFTWSLFGAGSLPLGLTINPTTGLIAGTLSASGTSTFTVAVSGNSGGLGCVQLKTYSISVTCPSNLVILPISNLANATIGVPYSQVLTIGGATNLNNFTIWSLTVDSDPLPPGLSLNSSTGVISGTPISALPTTSLEVSASYGGCLATNNYTLFVNLPCSTLNVSPAASAFTYTVGTAIPNINLSASGGVGPYTYTISAGALPAGVNIANGTISGTPTTASTGTFTVRATGANACTGATSYTFTATCPTINVSPVASALTYTVGTAIPNINFSASGGSAPYAYAMIIGALPVGVFINNGTIGGTPTTAGNGNFTVRATDANGCTGATTYTFTVNNAGCPTINVSPVASALTYTVNTAITNINLSASGGATPYTYAISAGALPAGINIASGVISGTPTTVSTDTFTVRAADNNNCTGVITYTFTVNPVGTPVPTPVIPSNPTTSVDNSFEKSIKISPNPSKTDFSIDFGGLNMNKIIIRVYDMQGKVIYVSNVTSNLSIISLDKSNNGMYLLEIQTENERITKRIVKQ